MHRSSNAARLSPRAVKANIVRSFDRLSDADLLSEIKRLARCERDATATLIASLMELDARQLYLAEGCSSLFTYCTAVLHLSEHAAYGRIKAARTAQAYPMGPRSARRR